MQAILEKAIEENESITEDDIEQATTDARYKLEPDIKEWGKDRSIDTTSPDSYDLVKQAIAYAAKPDEINPILKEKQKQRKENPDAYTKKICLRTSIGSIVEPLKTLKRRFESPNLKNLFAAVLEIDPDKIDVRKKRWKYEILLIPFSSVLIVCFSLKLVVCCLIQRVIH
jgi:hypothetical protein